MNVALPLHATPVSGLFIRASYNARMNASTGALTATFERLMGTPPSTAMHIAQQLRQDESIFRRGKRGPGANTVSPSEASNWLLALCAAASIGMRRGPNVVTMVQ